MFWAPMPSSPNPKSQKPQAHLISLPLFAAVVIFKQTLYVVSSINILVCISKQTKDTKGFSWLLNYHDFFFKFVIYFPNLFFRYTVIMFSILNF